MFRLLRGIIVLSLPLLVKYIYLLFFIDWDLFNSKDIREDLLFFLIIVLLFYGNPFKKQIWSDLLCFVYILYFILETSSYIAVSSNFSSSYMYLLLDSNNQELGVFLFSYISWSILAFIFLNVIVFFIVRKVQLKASIKHKLLICTFGFVGIVAFLKFTGLIESNVYHNIVRGTSGYIELQNSIKFESKVIKDDISINANNEVLVFVLGESTARGHMQIHGYEKETTPLLTSIRDSLFIYNNVISTDVLTLKSVPKILSSLDVGSKNKSLYNLVEVFNVAGYNTYWLSNQRPISYHDNVISKIASRSTMFKFYNHIIDKHTLTLDEIMLPDYRQILELPGKKVVFVRLIGTHFDYIKRYPASYNNFKNNADKSKKKRIINHYDNAVLYNDFIVKSLIDDLKKINKKSALIYVSDHGENVYDGTDFYGRNEEVLTKSMFEIPFLFWTSNDFNFPIDFDFKPNRKFMADHTYESVGHLFGVVHKSMDTRKSIFSKAFLQRKRWVVDNSIDYDVYFSGNYGR